MLAEPGFTQHLAGIATNRYGNSSLKIMMVIKGEPMWKFGDTAFVVCDMAEVFTDVFKIAFEATHGHRIKIDHTGFALDVLVVESDRVFGNNPVVETAYLSQYSLEVFCVQGTSQTFAKQNRVGG